MKFFVALMTPGHSTPLILKLPAYWVQKPSQASPLSFEEATSIADASRKKMLERRNKTTDGWIWKVLSEDDLSIVEAMKA